MATTVLGLGIFLASCVPFVPTGEGVSAASALASGSLLQVLAVYVVVVVGSLAGDTVMLLGAEFLVRRLGPRQRDWFRAHRLAPAVERARRSISSHAGQSIVIGRLVPGSRAPVIIALSIGRYPVRKFLAADGVACATWAAIYVSLGAAGGRLSGHPLLGTVIAVACAVGLGLVIGKISALRSSRRETGPADAAAVSGTSESTAPAHADHDATVLQARTPLVPRLRQGQRPAAPVVPVVPVADPARASAP